ncbi:MAG: hypothetical protein IJK14_08805 [Clostridia bacterium]|nr:hypothetical protein [Clostridia bacterium]
MDTVVKKKISMYTEAAYLLGLLFLALGTAFMDLANLGMGMVIVPSYVIFLKLSQHFSFFTFGTTAYLFQLVLLILLAIAGRKFRLSYLFAFMSAFLFGCFLDLFELLVLKIPCETLPARIVFYTVGEIFCAWGVSFMFHTYVTPEVYELIVKEVSRKRQWNINRVKTAYDIASVALGIILSFSFFGFGRFEGIKIGTLICALINGPMISVCSKANEALFEFKDLLRLRTFFEGIENEGEDAGQPDGEADP